MCTIREKVFFFLNNSAISLIIQKYPILQWKVVCKKTCDTPRHLKTTNSPDEGKINLIRKRLEGIKGTFLKMVEKICFKHDDSIMEKNLKQSQISHRKQREAIKRQSLVVIKV